MNPKGQDVQHVRIVLSGSPEQEASVVINGVEAGSVKVMTQGGEETHLVDIPADLRKENSLNVTIKGNGSKPTPKIYEVRIVK